MTNLPNNTPSEQPANAQASSPSPSRQSLESELIKIAEEWAESHEYVQFEAQAEETLKTVDRNIKSAFYAGQAMAGVGLEDCHANWKKWNSNDE